MNDSFRPYHVFGPGVMQLFGLNLIVRRTGLAPDRLEITRTGNHYPDVPEADYALTIEREHSVRTGQGREQGQGLAFPSGFPSRFTVS